MNQGRGVTTTSSGVGLGRTLTSTGRAEEALPLLEDALSSIREQLGPAHWRTADAELALGVCLTTLSRHADAEPLLTHADSILNLHRRGQPLPAREAKAALAQLYRAWGKPTPARGSPRASQ